MANDDWQFRPTPHPFLILVSWFFSHLIFPARFYSSIYMYESMKIVGCRYICRNLYRYFTSFLFRLLFSAFLFSISHRSYRRWHSTHFVSACRTEDASEWRHTARCMPLCLDLITQSGKPCILSFVLGNLLYTYGEAESEIGHVEMWILLD